MADETKSAGPPTEMACSVWEGDLPNQLFRAFESSAIQAFTYVGQNFFICPANETIPLIDYLKTECGFDYLVELTAVDYPKKPERFELIYILYSYARNERVRIKTLIPDGATPPTAVTRIEKPTIEPMAGKTQARHTMPAANAANDPARAPRLATGFGVALGLRLA